MQKVDPKFIGVNPGGILIRTSLVLITLIVSSSAFPSSKGMKEAWGPHSDPVIMNDFFNKNFSELPLHGSVRDSQKFWSGDYWALRKGNINFRWYAKNKIGFNHNSPPKERAIKMTIPELAELSPSEKYDLFTGRYDYPLRNEVNRIADPGAAIWEGICHGWSPATMNHNEPVPKLMTNPDGIEVPFGSTDIKALISYYYAHGFTSPDTHQMGRRCFKGAFGNRDPDCGEDLNAGAFHVVLANRLGIEGKGIIADLQRYKEVWNHPIISYSSSVIGTSRPDAFAANGTAKQVELKTVITYVDQNGHDWQPVIGTRKQHSKKTTYHYKLDLNADGTIIGGGWRSKERPDFLWLMARPRQFQGTLYRLGELLNDD